VTRRAQPPLLLGGRMGGGVQPEGLAASTTLTTGRRVVAGGYGLRHDAPRGSRERRRACVRGGNIVVLPKQGVPTRSPSTLPAQQPCPSATVEEAASTFGSCSSRRSVEAACLFLRTRLIADRGGRVDGVSREHHRPTRPFLRVEAAARVLRISRTSAYALRFGSGARGRARTDGQGARRS
jgi:hypothetical protein